MEISTMVIDSGVFIEHLLRKKQVDILTLTKDFNVLSFTDEVAIKAAKLYLQFNQQNYVIEFRDIFITAT